MRAEVIRRQKLHEQVAARLEELIHSSSVGGRLPSERD